MFKTDFDQPIVSAPVALPRFEEYAATIPAELQAKFIYLMDKGQLLKLQSHMQLGSTWGVISVPLAWLGSNSRSKRTTNLYTAFEGSAKNNEELELAVITAIRMFLILIIVPSQPNPKRPAQTLAVTTAVSYLQGQFNVLIREALTKPIRKDGKLLARIDRRVFPENARYSKFSPQYVRFDQYTERGYWADAVSDSKPDSSEEQSNRGEKVTRKEKAKKTYKPLPDKLIHAVGSVASWIISNLSPMATQVYEDIIGTRKGTRDQRERNAKIVLKNASWMMSDGTPLKLPVELSKIVFPPKTYLDALELICPVPFDRKRV